MYSGKGKAWKNLINPVLWHNSTTTHIMRIFHTNETCIWIMVIITSNIFFHFFNTKCSIGIILDFIGLNSSKLKTEVKYIKLYAGIYKFSKWVTSIQTWAIPPCSYKNIWAMSPIIASVPRELQWTSTKNKMYLKMYLVYLKLLYILCIKYTFSWSL